MSDILELLDITVGYDKNAILKGVSVNVASGEIVTIIGPNGCGKSTILKSVVNELSLIEGVIFIEGTSTSDMNNAEIAKFMSMVMTERISPELMTVRDVVETGRYPYTGRFGTLSEDDHKIVDRSIEMLCIEDIEECYFSKISDGQRQRVMLARAICQEPKVLILDEPTSYLDMRYKIDILMAIKKMAKEKNVSVLMSLHELDLVKQIADKVICVEDGKLGKCGSVKEIFSGNYLHRLYQVDESSFDCETGMIHIEPQNTSDLQEENSKNGNDAHVINTKPEYVLPGDIEKRSFEIIQKELDSMGIALDEIEAPVTKRVIHTSADFDYVHTMTYSKDAIHIARELIKAGADIVTDTNMAKAGINKAKLESFGGSVHCYMADDDVAIEAKERQVTRATVSMERAAKLKKPVIFAIGNAPTALISLKELMDNTGYKPAFIIGVPVGFVNVEAAKELFIGGDVPYIINRGRKGGSNIAAAICNALIYGI